MDPITRRRFWELIYEAGAAGTSVLVTTHYLDEAEYCGRISIMVNGAIAAMGTPGEVRRSVGARDAGRGVPEADPAGDRRVRAFVGFVRKETLHLLRDRQTLASCCCSRWCRC